LESVAFGWPGIEARWTSSSKEGVGTAYADASRVWFTLSHGILNEVYYPTVDRPQIRDLQLLVTDGESFFHEEKRDLASETSVLEPGVLGYRIVSTDPAGRYRIEKEVIADSVRSCVLVNVKVVASEEWRERLKVYVLLAPTSMARAAETTRNAAWRHARKCWWRTRGATASPSGSTRVFSKARADMWASATDGRT
jgi:Glucoamylase and related glycosyl hydrolases